MNKFEWIFRIFDKASGPARTIDNGLAKLQDRFRKAGSAVDGFMKHLQDLFFLKEAVGLVGELANKLREMGREVLAGIAFKQNAIIALEALSGTRDGAIDLFQEVEDFAWKTGKRVEDVMATTKNLLSAGFDKGEVGYLRQVLGDLAIIDPAKASQAEELIGRVQRAGMMSGREFHQLKGLVPLAEFQTELGKLLGGPVSLEAIEARGVAATDAIKALLAAFVRLYSGGVAGNRLAQVMNTLPAALERVRQLPGRILDELAGFGGGQGTAFDRIMKNIADAFDPEGPSGKRIVATLRGLLGKVGEMFGISAGDGGLLADLAGPNGVTKIEEIFRKMTKAVEDSLPALRDAASALKMTVDAIAWVLDKGQAGSRALRWLTGLNEDTVKNVEPHLPTFQAAAEARKRGLSLPETINYVRERSTELRSQAAPFQVEANFYITGVSRADEGELRKSITEAIADTFEKLAHQRGVAPQPDW